MTKKLPSRRACLQELQVVRVLAENNLDLVRSGDVEPDEIVEALERIMTKCDGVLPKQLRGRLP